MNNDLLVVLIVIVYIAILYTVPIILYKRKKLSGRAARNIIHFFAGLSILALYFASNKWIFFIASLGITAIVFFSRKNTPLLNHVYNAIAEDEEKTYLQGPVLYGLSISYLILFSIVFNNNLIPLVSTLILTVSDPLAAIVGKKYGKNVLFLFGSKRTVEGSISMLISNFIIISIFFGFGMKALAIGFIITIIELISPSKIDDFTLPLSASILLINY